MYTSHCLQAAPELAERAEVCHALSDGGHCICGAQVMSKALKEAGYYKKKGVVEKLAGRYIAQICMSDSGDVLQASGPRLRLPDCWASNQNLPKFGASLSLAHLKYCPCLAAAGLPQ